MSNTTHQLRLNAYSVNDAGHIICNNEERPDERTAVLRIDIAEDSKAGREIVARLLALVDEPRALTGVSRNGSAVLLFRRGERSPVPHIQGSPRRDGVFEMATRDGEVRFTIKCASAGTVDVSEYAWPKGRSPLEVESFRLPVLTDTLGAAVVREAFNLGCMWGSQYDEERASAARTAQVMADIASGKIKILTDEERAIADDEATVAANEGRDLSYSDGPFAINILAARKRVALRKQQQAAAA